MTTTIKTILAREVLDSRGFPTVQADVIPDNGMVGRGTAPSGGRPRGRAHWLAECPCIAIWAGDDRAFS